MGGFRGWVPDRKRTEERTEADDEDKTSDVEQELENGTARSRKRIIKKIWKRRREEEPEEEGGRKEQKKWELEQGQNRTHISPCLLRISPPTPLPTASDIQVQKKVQTCISHRSVTDRCEINFGF